MKLQQLRFLLAVARNGLNISHAAAALYTSQPGISKQLRQLEQELGVELFKRTGKHLVALTPVGEQIIIRAARIMAEVSTIRQLAAEDASEEHGHLALATTPTQARYVLPAVITSFRERYPNVTLQIHQGTPTQLHDLALRGEVDFVIATEAMELFDDVLLLPCYRWERAIVVPLNHPLIDQSPLTIETLAAYPLVTYVFGFTGHSRLDQAFANAKVQPRIALTATDTDVIKTYVRLGLGVGIMAGLACDSAADTDLVKLSAGHLFTSSTTQIGFRRGTYLRRYMKDFIYSFAPHLTAELIESAQSATGMRELQAIFAELKLPLR